MLGSQTPTHLEQRATVSFASPRSPQHAPNEEGVGGPREFITHSPAPSHPQLPLAAPSHPQPPPAAPTSSRLRNELVAPGSSVSCSGQPQPWEQWLRTPQRWGPWNWDLAVPGAVCRLLLPLLQPHTGGGSIVPTARDQRRGIPAAEGSSGQYRHSPSRPCLALGAPGVLWPQDRDRSPGDSSRGHHPVPR